MRSIFFAATIILLSIPHLAYAAGANLLVNPNFDNDVSGWSVQSQASVQWDGSDADSSLTSGSAFVTNANSPCVRCSRGIEQCVQVIPGLSYDFGATLFVPAGQAATGNAFIRGFFLAGSDCSGSNLGHLDTPSNSVEQQWETVQVQGQVAPGGAQGFLLQLQVGPLADVGPFSAYADKMFVIPEPSMPLLLTATFLALVALASRRRARGTSI